MKNNILDILKKQGSGFKTPEGYFDTVEDEVFAKQAAEKFPKKEGFTIPKDYFESVEDKVFQQLSKKALSKDENFDVPKNYFESIEDKVFDKLHKATIKQPKFIDFKSRFVKMFIPLAVAASLLLIFALNYTSNNVDTNVNNVASTDIETWIDNDLIILDLNQIAEVFNDVSLVDELNSEDEELLNYVNGTDIESILNN